MMSLIVRLVAFAIISLRMAHSIAAYGFDVRPDNVNLHICEVLDRDKTGTNSSRKNETGSQTAKSKPNASRVSFGAEGKGFEPSTGFPAPDFESGIAFS